MVNFTNQRLFFKYTPSKVDRLMINYTTLFLLDSFLYEATPKRKQAADWGLFEDDVSHDDIER